MGKVRRKTKPRSRITTINSARVNPGLPFDVRVLPFSTLFSIAAQGLQVEVLVLDSRGDIHVRPVPRGPPELFLFPGTRPRASFWERPRWPASAPGPPDPVPWSGTFRCPACRASSAASRFSICSLALVFLASSVRPMNRGRTSPARMPRMTITTMSSIRVKPPASVLLENLKNLHLSPHLPNGSECPFPNAIGLNVLFPVPDPVTG